VTVVEGDPGVLVDSTGTVALVTVCCVNSDTVMGGADTGATVVVNFGWIAVLQVHGFQLMDGKLEAPAGHQSRRTRRSDFSEEDVMVAVVPRPGESIDLAELIEFCQSRMARQTVPRYIDVVDQLPRTPTEKIEERCLQGRAVTTTTWDREVAPRQP
jgi:acyl-CoA synthetase (AMP-forming)/AMP-acid ligase II